MEYFPGVKPIGDPIPPEGSRNAPSRLEIHVHLVNGHVEKFNQLDPDKLREHFRDLQPNKIFSLRHLSIDTPDGVFAYPTHAICRIEYLMDWTPAWAQTKGRDVTVITAEEFRENRKESRLTREDIKGLKPGDNFTGHSVVELENGDKVYLRLETTVPAKLDQRLIIAQILQSGTLMGKLKEGGVGFINGDKIVRIAFYPGVPELSPDAWKMNCM